MTCDSDYCKNLVTVPKMGICGGKDGGGDNGCGEHFCRLHLFYYPEQLCGRCQIKHPFYEGKSCGKKSSQY